MPLTSRLHVPLLCEYQENCSSLDRGSVLLITPQDNPFSHHNRTHSHATELEQQFLQKLLELHEQKIRYTMWLSLNKDLPWAGGTQGPWQQRPLWKFWYPRLLSVRTSGKSLPLSIAIDYKY
jgi:hypothetical protein